VLQQTSVEIHAYRKLHAGCVIPACINGTAFGRKQVTTAPLERSNG
jgi:hypothetical protein